MSDNLEELKDRMHKLCMEDKFDCHDMFRATIGMAAKSICYLITDLSEAESFIKAFSNCVNDDVDAMVADGILESKMRDENVYALIKRTNKKETKH